MTARPTLTFRPRALASEVAFLGEIVAGEIIPCGGKATWVMRLNDVLRKSGPASTFEAARRKIEHEVNDWLRRAGLMGLGPVDVVVEASERRASA